MDLYMPYWTVSFRMTMSDVEWLSEIFNENLYSPYNGTNVKQGNKKREKT